MVQTITIYKRTKGKRLNAILINVAFFFCIAAQIYAKTKTSAKRAVTAYSQPP